MRRNLVIVRAGDTSLHPSWLDPEAPRDFDLLVSYYGGTEGKFAGGADRYHTLAGPRWPAHHRLCKERWASLAAYDHVAFAADDLEMPQARWNRLFDICRELNLHLAQPAVEGHVNHLITARDENYLARRTNFVEIMCPVFSRDTLAALRWTFAESVSGWGLDFLWSHLLPYPDYRIGIVDAAPVVHTRAAGQGSLVPVLAAQGVDPEAEAFNLLKKHGLTEPKMIVYGGAPNRP